MRELGIQSYGSRSPGLADAARRTRAGERVKGLDFYRRLPRGLRERGIEPFADASTTGILPQALQDAAAGPSRDVVERFAEYARPRA
jgi:beta-glucosidase/6-phospho-beta-glucosidase/beta-galactosidase